MGALNTSYTSGSVLPAADMNATNAAVNGVTLNGTYASMPSASQPGRIYYCTDCDAVFQDTGTQWNRVKFGQNGTTQALPPTTGWTTLASGTSSVVAAQDGYLMTAVGTSSNGWLFHYRATPGGTYTAKYYFDWNILPTQSGSAGCAIVSDGTKLVTYGVSGGTIFVNEYWNQTSFNANEFSSGVTLAHYPGSWLGINDDGTNRNYLISRNGIDWVTIYSTSRTTWLTATQIGWGMNSNYSTGLNTYGRLRSFAGVP